MWFPAIYILECGTGIKAEGSVPADSCAFGYYWSQECGTCLHLDGPNSSMFTIRYMHPMASDVVFKATGGAGRLYVQSVNVVLGGETTGENILLDVTGSLTRTGLLHINGVTGDGNTVDYQLLKNHDDGNGLTHVRFTNCHFVNTGDPHVVKIDIDRSQSTSGQTVVELAGCRGVALGNGVLFENVTIKGASSSAPSRLIVRDSELLRTAELIDPDPNNPSSHYTDNRISNWVFSDGKQDDIMYSG